MRVLSLNFGGASCASTACRVLAMIEPLRAFGIEVETREAADFSAWNTLPTFDLVLVQKRLFSTGRVRAIRRLARRLAFDVDDAIWHPHGRRHHWLTRWRTHRRVVAVARAADLCMAANGVLARHLQPWARRVEQVPMALPGELWPARAQQPSGSGSTRIGWIGGPGNLRYLEAIEPALAEVRRQRPGVLLEVFCGRAPAFREVPVEHTPFTPGAEPGAAQRFDIGLLPLPDDPFAQGKSPVKALQYLASGAAIVASPVGATTELLANGSTALFATSIPDWTRAILQLVDDPQRRASMARAGRAHFEAHHTVSAVSRRLAALLHSLSAT